MTYTAERAAERQLYLACKEARKSYSRSSVAEHPTDKGAVVGSIPAGSVTNEGVGLGSAVPPTGSAPGNGS